MTNANNMLWEGMSKKNNVHWLNTNILKRMGNFADEGKFTWRKSLFSLVQLFKGSFKILFSKGLEVVYITPGQSAVGYMKYTPFMWAARIRKIPCYIHIHGGYFRTMYNGLRGWKKRIVDKSLRELAGAIVLGPSLRVMFEGLVPDEKIFVCENGVEDEVFATEEEIRQKIERYNTDDTIRVVYLSNLMESKGILDLFEAVTIVGGQGKKIHLDVAGAIELAIEDRVKAYLEELGDTVTYHGVVDGKKKKELLLNNYIFCLPSKHPYGEGQPISILEAMANGCAIVTTDHGGIKDIVNEEFSAFVKKGNPESIVERFTAALQPVAFLRSWNAASAKYRMSHFSNRIERILMGE